MNLQIVCALLLFCFVTLAMARPRPPVYQPNYDDSQDYGGYDNRPYNSNNGYNGNNKNPYGNYGNNPPAKRGQQGYPPNPNQARKIFL